MKVHDETLRLQIVGFGTSPHGRFDSRYDQLHDDDSWKFDVHAIAVSNVDTGHVQVISKFKHAPLAEQFADVMELIFVVLR